MKHVNFVNVESSHFDEEFPYFESIQVYFKTKSDRTKFLRIVINILQKDVVGLVVPNGT